MNYKMGRLESTLTRVILNVYSLLKNEVRIKCTRNSINEIPNDKYIAALSIFLHRNLRIRKLFNIMENYTFSLHYELR